MVQSGTRRESIKKISWLNRPLYELYHDWEKTYQLNHYQDCDTSPLLPSVKSAPPLWLYLAETQPSETNESSLQRAVLLRADHITYSVQNNGWEGGPDKHRALFQVKLAWKNAEEGLAKLFHWMYVTTNPLVLLKDERLG